MALWRVHVELEDRPGRLGELATAVGAAGGNILHLHLVGEPADDGSVTDELLVKMPDGTDPATLLDAVQAVGIPCTLMLPADATELADTATTALALARMVAADPGSAPRAAATMLRAQLIDPAGTGPLEHTCTLRIGTQQLRLRRAWPFTATEISRAAALLELAAQLDIRAPLAPPAAERIVLLRDGSEVQMRPAEPSDAPLVAALHARCSPESRRARFLSPTPQLPPAELTGLLGGEPGRGGSAVLAVTTDGGSAVGVATLTPEGPTTARFAVLVEDAWQGRGLGTALLRRIAETAVEQGAHELVGSARPAELALTRLLRRAGLQPSAELVSGRLRLRAPLPAPVG